MDTLDGVDPLVLVGGTNAGNAASQVQSWNNILEFLNKYFGKEKNPSGLAGLCY